jgi:hypothetical protein
LNAREEACDTVDGTDEIYISKARNGNTFPFKIRDIRMYFLYASSWMAEHAEPGAVMTYTLELNRL